MQNVRKYWYYYFGGLCALLLIISAVLRVLTPPPIPIHQSPTLTQNYDGTKTTFQNIQFTGNPPQLPTQLSIAKAAPSSLTTEKITGQFIDKFQLKPLAQPPNVWVGKDYSLTKDEGMGFFILVKNIPSTSTAVVNKNQALASAQSLLSTFFPNITLSPVLEKIGYLEGGTEPAPTTPEKAQTMYIPFSYKIDNYPVFYQNQREYPFEVVMNNSNEIQRLFFYPFFYTFSSLEKKAPISIQAAMQNTQNGKASVVGSRADVGGPTQMSQVSSANFTDVSLEYRVDDKSQLAYPFYRFSGSGVDARGKKISLEVITPAVQTQP